MYVLDTGKDPTIIMPVAHVPHLIQYMAGESTLQGNNGTFLSEDVLRQDERVLIEMNQTSVLSDDHPLVTSLSRVRKADSSQINVVERMERRPSKRPRLNPSMTSALPSAVKDMVHVVRDGLEDLKEFVTSGKLQGFEPAEATATVQNQLQQCVTTLRLLLDDIGEKKKANVA